MNCTVVKRYINPADAGQFALFPVYRSGIDEIGKLKVNWQYRAKVWRPRNLKYHNLFFALCALVVDNSEIWQTVDQFRKAFLIYAGFVEVVPGIDGEPVAVPDSMAFDKMDEETFDRDVMPMFWQVVARELKIDIEDLKLNYERYLQEGHK